MFSGLPPCRPGLADHPHRIRESPAVSSDIRPTMTIHGTASMPSLAPPSALAQSALYFPYAKPTTKFLAETNRLRANGENYLSQSLAIQRDLDAGERDISRPTSHGSDGADPDFRRLWKRPGRLTKHFMADRMTNSAELRCGAVAAELRDRAAKCAGPFLNIARRLPTRRGSWQWSRNSSRSSIALPPRERLLRYVLLPDEGQLWLRPFTRQIAAWRHSRRHRWNFRLHHWR